MMTIETVEGMNACRKIWQDLWPTENIFDVWQVRECFARSYDRPNLFLVSKGDGRPNGLLALSWVDEVNRFCHFPGELWHGKTWLEQNRVVAGTPDVFSGLINHIPGAAHVRYLRGCPPEWKGCHMETDEKAYMFFPKAYGYDFNTYLNAFPNKTRKKILGEVSRLREKTVTFRYDHMEDLERLFKLNMDAFGKDSYFEDHRFFKGFTDLAAWLKKENMLRLTTVLVGGEVAAVDMGVVYRKNYTLIAGGTHPEFKGVAKLINLHHIETACREKFDRVEFLCGDFGWKERFHLEGTDLYQFTYH